VIASSSPAPTLEATTLQRATSRKRKRLRLSRGLLGAVIITIIALAALFAEVLPLADPNATELSQRLAPPTGFGGTYPLGSDQLGRDILSRIVFGARISLLVGFLTVFIAGSIGVALGLVAGYFGGWADHVLMRLVDVMLAFPFFVMALALVSVLRPSLTTTVAVLSIWGWSAYCRLVRGTTLSIREKEFISAAQVVGCSNRHVLMRHILPNTVPLILVLATAQVAQMIVAESALSFLGIGVPPPTPSWGSIIGEGRQYVSSAWWITTFPGIVLTVAVLGIGFVGDWLRDALDPQLRQ
jgi:peptide/nickel transport system permease protein